MYYLFILFFTDTDNIKSDFKKQRKFFRRKKILPLVTKPPKLQQYVNQKVIKSTKPDIFNTTKSMESLFPKLKNENNEAYNRSQNHPRFLSIFTIVRFDNDICTAGTGDNGTCYRCDILTCIPYLCKDICNFFQTILKTKKNEFGCVLEIFLFP